MSIYNFISSSDSSLYNNPVNYVSMSFSMSAEGIESIFSSSYIELSDSSNYNFDYNEDFAVSFYLNSKSSTAPILYKFGASKKQSNLGTIVANIYDYSISNPQYPYKIDIISDKLYFQRYDGSTISQVTASFTTGTKRHVLCQKSGSELQIWINGSKISSGSDNSSYSTKNNSLVFVGANGSRTEFLSGSMSQIMIFAGALTSSTTVSNLSSSYDNSPNIGNIVYEHGMYIITKPGKYQNVFKSGSSHSYIATFSSSVEYTEQKYRCLVQPDEFDFTSNPTALDFDGNVKNIQTSSLFSPYITSIGLYNNDNELVAIGKLAQPIKKNKKVPINFVVRYDM
jgi:hypothetical protein